MQRPKNIAHISDVERAALASLSKEFGASLHHYFRRRVKEHPEIDDLVQDVLIRLVSHPEVAEMDSARGYVFATARSVLNDWLRKRQSRNADRHEEFTAAHDSGVEITPEHVLLHKRRLARATAILLELPERTRNIFVLRRIEGMKYRDIAARLDISVSAAEKHMARAITYLTENFEE